MRVDKIGQVNYTQSAGANFTQNYEQIPVTHILLQSSEPLKWNDRLSLKFRHEGRISIIHDNISASHLQSYHDYHFGSAGGIKKDLFSTKVATSAYKKPYVVVVPVGHLSLNGKHQLEITFTSQAVAGDAGKQEVVFMAVHLKNAPDHLLAYDLTFDNDTTQDMVREVFALSTTEQGFVNSNGTYVDLRFDVKTAKHQTSNSIEDYLGVTSAFGRYEIPSLSNLVILASYPEALPEKSVRIKSLGSSACDSGLMIVKEMLLKNTSESTLSQLQELKDQVKAMEKENAELAKLYRHAQSIPKSDVLEADIKTIEAGKVAEQNAK